MNTYCVWHHKTTQFYDDDGGGSTSNKSMIDSDTDIQVLRERCNAHFTVHKDRYRGKPPLFAPGAMKSSEWFSDGGGCLARGHLEIRVLELPRL